MARQTKWDVGRTAASNQVRSQEENTSGFSFFNKLKHLFLGGGHLFIVSAMIVTF